jgi:hypothetical protein
MSSILLERAKREEPFLRAFRAGWWLPKWTGIPALLDAFDRVAARYLEWRGVR